MAKQRRYLAYLLRMWQTSDGEKKVWRASVQTPDGKERYGFANLEALMSYLQAQAEQSEDEEKKRNR